MALASLAFTLLLGAVSGQLGPSTTLSITNQNIAPDGFVRSAILAGGSFPGPLITAQPVRIRIFKMRVTER
jgi:iron transport multicopper oxidase